MVSSSTVRWTQVALTTWRSVSESERDISVGSFSGTWARAPYRSPKQTACKEQNGCSTKRSYRWRRSPCAPASAVSADSIQFSRKCTGGRRPRYRAPRTHGRGYFNRLKGADCFERNFRTWPQAVIAAHLQGNRTASPDIATCRGRTLNSPSSATKVGVTPASKVAALRFTVRLTISLTGE